MNILTEYIIEQRGEAIIALNKAKKIEKERMKKGWKYLSTKRNGYSCMVLTKDGKKKTVRQSIDSTHQYLN